MSVLNGENHWLGNHLTLDELAQIEANAERSKTPEAETILRLAAALREAMQVSEGAFACLDRNQESGAEVKTGDRRRGFLARYSH
ncbi:MAG TPA: hypothetical protein VF290_16040 [Pyrinomonadaceae bacterium]